MAASNLPGRCAQCGWNPTAPGHVVCSKCASRTLALTCPHSWRPELVVQRASNGYLRPELRCRQCYRSLGNPKLRDVDVDQADTVTVSLPEGACSRCGRTDAIEVHHWAPRHLFADADDWPTSRLCPDCHGLWHRVTGTTG